MDWSQNHVKLFRALLYCYPAEFRHEYGTEMQQLFAERLRREPRLWLWLETLSDLGISAAKEHLQILLSDIRYGLRVLAAAPGFTGIALLVMALGIGSTVSIFSVVNAVLIRSLPYAHPSELVYLWSPNPNLKGVPQELGPNVPDFYEWQRLSHSFSDMAMFRPAVLSLVQSGAANRVRASFVTGTFFRTLAAWPILGRALGPTDDRPGHEHVAVISDALWRSHFGAAPAIIGQQVQLNRQNYTVVGVMPKDFGYPFSGDVPYEKSEFKQTDIWLPAAYTAAQKADRSNFASADAIGRLKNGIPAAVAQAELVSIESRLQPLYPDMWKGWTVLASPLVQTIIGPVEKMLWLLLGSVGLVLLIAIGNTANLLLARAAVRSHELGIRTALGAERSRIVRQLLTESLLLSCLGGALGVALAYAIVAVLVKLNPRGIPRFDTAAVDARVLLVALVLSIAAGVAAGLAPALSASRAGITDLIKRGGRGLSGSVNTGRFTLIVFEVALSVVLLTGSALLIRSYLQLQAVNPGFSPSTLTFTLNLDERYNKPALRTAFYIEFLEKLRNLPGVQYAGSTNSIPLSHHESVTFAYIRGFGESTSMIEGRSVTPDYRRALGVPLLRGRDFDGSDVNSKTPVMLVNQSFVDKYFRGRDPLGGQVRIGMGNLANTPWSTVVGVVGNIRHANLEEPSQPQMFQPADNGNNFALQCGIPAEQIIKQARTALHALDPVLVLEGVHTMRERMDDSTARRRFQTSLLTGFAAMAVALALVGLYGLMSYTVKQRKSEIGVRLAVGSSQAQVVALILSQGLRLTAYGLFIGLIGAFALTRLVKGWLFGVSALDPATFVAVPLLILAVACCACVIPAWQATRIDPIQALRAE
jgi:predicted permease